MTSTFLSGDLHAWESVFRREYMFFLSSVVEVLNSTTLNFKKPGRNWRQLGMKQLPVAAGLYQRDDREWLREWRGAGAGVHTPACPGLLFRVCAMTHKGKEKGGS